MGNDLITQIINIGDTFSYTFSFNDLVIFVSLSFLFGILFGGMISIFVYYRYIHPKVSHLLRLFKDNGEDTDIIRSYVNDQTQQVVKSLTELLHFLHQNKEGLEILSESVVDIKNGAELHGLLENLSKIEPGDISKN